jgi:glycosyltransferase involved in cell wall biosynthesis
MRILVLTSKFIWPLTDGAVIRDYNLLCETARRHDVYLLCFLFKPEDREQFGALEPYCKKIIGIDLHRPKWQTLRNAVAGSMGPHPFILREYYRRDMAAAIDKVIAEEKIDVVHAHFLHMAQYFAGLKSTAVVFDTHNLEHVLWQRLSQTGGDTLKRAFAGVQQGKLLRWHQEVGLNCEVNVTLSDEDRDEYLRIAPDADVMTVPNGADTKFWHPMADAVEPHSVIYFGNLSWPPQADAAIHFHDESLPLIRREFPDTTFYVVGQNPPESVKALAGDKVVVTGFVDDVRPYIARSAVVAMPLRIGAGTKHRVFQALSMEKPMVASSVAKEGIPLVHGETAMLADEPGTFAAHVITLLKNPEMRAKMGKAGRKMVLDRYDWSAIYPKLEEAFQRADEKWQRRT